MKSAPEQTILIANNIASVRKRIQQACTAAGRQPETVNLLGISKTKPASDIRAAFDAGLSDFGENYLQEAMEKTEKLQDLNIIWHYTGQIQSNKSRWIAEKFDWVHTLMSLKAARRLNNQRPQSSKNLQVLIQVNVDKDPAKSGLYPEDLPDFLESILKLEKLTLRGLMTIPTQSQVSKDQRAPFARLRQLMEKALSDFGNDLPEFNQLSMGMSADLEAAILEGATWVRVGTDIFGKRL